MCFNIEDYRHYTDGMDLSDAQKDELIRTIWALIEAQVDQAFGLHPVQHATAAKSEQKKLFNATKDRLDSKSTRLTSSFQPPAQTAEKG